MFNQIKKRGTDKRGQQEISLGTILLLILGIVALIFIIIGVTMGFDQFFGAFNLLPNDLTKMATACKAYSETEALRLSYCQFYEGRIQGKKGWYNCIYIHNVARETLGEVDFLLLTCADNLEKTQCESLKTEKAGSFKDTVWVNGKQCKDWDVTST